MASVSASSLILFIAAIAVAATVSGAMVNTVADISNSVDQKGVDVANEIDTDVEIISDAGSDAVYDESTYNVTVLVKNTGDRTLEASPERIDVLLDGQYVSSDDLDVTVVSGDAWREGDVIELEIDNEADIGNGEHRVTVIVRDHREVFTFFV